MKASAQKGADAGEEFVFAEGFAEEVVGAEFEAEDDIDFFGLGGDKHDGNFAVVLANFTADIVAGFLWHHDVEKEEIDGVPGPEVDRGGSIGSGEDVIAFFLKNLGHHFPGVGFVFGEKDFHCGSVRRKVVSEEDGRRVKSPPMLLARSRHCGWFR